VMSDSDAGATIAAPTPCTARAATRRRAWSANPAANDEKAKTSSPKINSRRRPNVSATRPPKIKRPPKAMAYAVTTHWTESPPKPSEWRIERSPTLTMLKSKTTMNDATRTNVSADLDIPSARALAPASVKGTGRGDAVVRCTAALLRSALSRVSVGACRRRCSCSVWTGLTVISLFTVRYVSYTYCGTLSSHDRTYEFHLRAAWSTSQRTLAPRHHRRHE